MQISHFKTAWLYFLIFWCPNLVSSQELPLTTVDSLEQLLQTAVEDTVLYNILYDLHSYYEDKDADKALRYLHQKITLSERMKDRLRLARSLNHLSFFGS